MQHSATIPGQRITIVLATGNRDKVRELTPLLEEVSPLVQIRSFDDLGICPEIEETAPTLEGNAWLKAAAVFSLVESRFGQLIALADDTGLEVDALGGAPGVRSARFAEQPDGAAPTYDDNVTLLLHRLAGIADRSAHFRTVIAIRARLLGGDGTMHTVDRTVDGRVDGTITPLRRGTGGFGYDPVFLPAGGNRTFGEMTPDEKNTASHRAKAVAAAVRAIQACIADSGIQLNH